MKISVLLTLAFFCVLSPATASAKTPSFTEANCVRALIGEAGGQSDAELYAHACALYNRGTLQGVYGFYAMRPVKGQGLVRIRTGEVTSPEKVQKVMKLYNTAWFSDGSTSADVVDGRADWRSDYDLNKMADRGETLEDAGLYDGLKIGETTFYRLRRTN